MSYLGTTPAKQMPEIATGAVQTDDIQDSAVTAAKLAPGAAVPAQTGQGGKFLTTNGTVASWAAVDVSPRVTSVTYPGDDLALDPAGSQTLLINGANFISTPTIYISGTIAPSVTYISSTQLQITTPSKLAGTYDIYVVNPNGSVAILVMGVSYSGTPTWTTGAGSLGTVDGTFSIQLQAASNSAITYSLTSGSSLPSGVTLSTSGLVSGTLETEQTFSFSVDANDQENQTTARSFQVTISLNDPYFKYVTLLLAGDGTQGANNNTFADSSPNGFPITRNGNTTQGSFNPYGANWSNYFNSTTLDSIAAADSSSYILSGDFAIEAWVNPASYGTGGAVLAQWPGTSGATNQAFIFRVTSTGKIDFVYGVGGTNAIVYGTSQICPIGSWSHVLVTRSGSTVRLFVNGYLDTVGTVSGSLNDSNGVMAVGRTNATDGVYFNGYISNARIVNGNIPSAYQTTSTTLGQLIFSPSLTPLTAVSGTVFLACSSNRFTNAVDNSAMTANGTPKVTNFSPFVPTTPYAPTLVDGYWAANYATKTDSITFPSTAPITTFTGDFTLEAWVYPTDTSLSGVWGILDARTNGGTAANWVFDLTSYTAGSGWLINFYTGGNRLSSLRVLPNQWSHVAISRQGSTIRFFVNGQLDPTTSTLSGTLAGGTSTLMIGSKDSSLASYGTVGNISNLRITNGGALYTTAFTPSTTPLTTTVSAGTVTLLTCQSAAFVDNASNQTATVSGTVRTETFNPFEVAQGYWSNQFDGATSTRLTLPSTAALAFGANPYTVEAWIYLTAYSAVNISTIFIDCGATTNSLGLAVTGGGALSLNKYGIGTVFSTADGAVPLNTWVHVAVSRASTASNDTRLFVNGVLRASGTDGNTWSVTTTPSIGGINLSGYTITGYLSNARVVTGQALFTGAFIPSTTPLTTTSVGATGAGAATSLTGTVSLLTCQRNYFYDAAGNTITVSGTPQIAAQNPFPGGTPNQVYVPLGGSGYFDGSGDDIRVTTTSAAFDITGNFTAETWFYPTAIPIVGTILSIESVSSGYAAVELQVNTTRTLGLNIGQTGGAWATSGTSTATVTLNAWNHLAVARVGSAITLYLNGTSILSLTNGNALFAGGTAFMVGARQSGGAITGYLAGFRFINGSAEYTAAFTPPAVPPTAVTNTSLLLNFTNAGIYDSTTINDLETVGSAQVSTTIKKYGTGSIKFNGSTDFLYIPAVAEFGFGTGDFTVEHWVYPALAGSANQVVIDARPSDTGTPWLIGLTTAGAVRYYDGTTVRTGGTMTANTWNHVAWSRASGVNRVFLNGVQVSTYTATQDFGSSRGLTIGGNVIRTAEQFNGYIDEIRITKGIARYTADFTPPTIAHKTK